MQIFANPVTFVSPTSLLGHVMKPDWCLSWI